MKISLGILQIQSYMVNEATRIHEELYQINKKPQFNVDEYKKVQRLMGMLQAYENINKLIVTDEET